MNFSFITLGLAAAMLASSAFGNDGELSWSKSLEIHVDHAYAQKNYGIDASVVFVDTVISGSIAGSIVDGIYLGRGYGNSGTSTYHETQATPAPYSLLKSSEHFVTHTIKFDKLLVGGFLSDLGSLQNDHIITISGGNAVLFNRDVVITHYAGAAIQSNDWAIVGNGTSQMSFLKQGAADNWEYSFMGKEGLEIFGTWDTISITQFNQGGLASESTYDSQAGFRITSAAVKPEFQLIPEPSSALLAMTSGIFFLLRRRPRLTTNL